MKMAANATPDLEDFRIEDAEDARQHNPTVDKLLKYFEKKTGGVRLAKRRDLNPNDLKEDLPEIGLFEPIYGAEGQFVDADISLLGSRLDEFYGHMTGKRVNQFNNPQVAARVIEACREVTERKQPLVVHADALSRHKSHLSITVLYVPLSNDGKTVDRIFLHNQISSHYRGGGSH